MLPSCKKCSGKETINVRPASTRTLSKAEYKLISPLLETMERMGVKSIRKGSKTYTRDGDTIIETTKRKGK